MLYLKLQIAQQLSAQTGPMPIQSKITATGDIEKLADVILSRWQY